MAIKVDDKWLLENGKYECPYCKKQYSKFGISNHIWRNHTKEGKQFDPNINIKNGNKKVWNSGLTKETDEEKKIEIEKIKELLAEKL